MGHVFVRNTVVRGAAGSVLGRAAPGGGALSVFPLWAWVGFTALIVVLLVLDLLVFARGAREISFRRATVLSGFWIGLALLFGVAVFVVAGPERGGEYFTGYIVEKSLSVDNVFVFALIFSYFAVPARYQYRVLLWGIVGAPVRRGAFIAIGAQRAGRAPHPLRGARALPVQGAPRGHRRGARAARFLYSHRGRAPGPVRLDGLRLRGFPDLHRHQDGPPPGHGGPAGAQPGPAPDPAPRAHDGGLQGRQVLRAPRGQADGDAAVRGHRHGRHHRRRLCRGLDTGYLLHNVERVRRLVGQRLRGARPAAPVLHAGRHDGTLRLPEPRAPGGV